jgi:hypothetical protein
MMILELKVDRKWKKPDWTISNFFVNGVKWCNVLEDTDRGLNQNMPLSEIKKRKKDGITAIPSGRYEVVMRYSPHFKRETPWIKDVPGWQWVLIHAGNDPTHTLGCLLPGENKVKGKVLNSRVWEDRITAEIRKYDKCFITIL